MKTRPGADCGTDHSLLVMNLKIRLKKRKDRRELKNFDLQVTEIFAAEIKNRFQALELEGKDNEQMWNVIKTTIKDTTNETILTKPRQRKSKWLSVEAIKIAEDRSEVKARGFSDEVGRLNADFQRQARKDKEAYLEEKMPCD